MGGRFRGGRFHVSGVNGSGVMWPEPRGLLLGWFDPLAGNASPLAQVEPLPTRERPGMRVPGSGFDASEGLPAPVILVAGLECLDVSSISICQESP